MKKIAKYIFISGICLSIVLVPILHFAQCKVPTFVRSSMDFGTIYSINSCKVLLINFSYKKLIKIFNNSIFEIRFKEIKEHLYGRRYTILKKEYFDKNDVEESANNEKPFVKGIINDNMHKYLVENTNQLEEENDTWLRSHGGNKNLKYSNVKFNINPENINNLKLKWKHSSFDVSKHKNKWRNNIELNPVFVDNKIIFVSADYKIVALDAKGGNVLWKKQSLLEPSRRGMAISSENNKNYLFITIGNSMFKLDALNGNLVKNFGKNGAVKNAGSPTAPIIFKNQIYVVTSSKILGFSLENGKRITEIYIHPKNKKFIGGIPWGGTALDKNKGILFVVTGNPRPALVGIDRPNENKRANSLIAFDLMHNKILWSFQDVMHDLWDLDIASPPILTEVKINQKILEVVIATTKTGNVLIFDRKSGLPYFDIQYSEAPKSKIPGEKTSEFQISLELPEKLSDINYGEKDIRKLSENKKKHIQKQLDRATYGWFEPPEFGKKLIMFGVHGGATWPGSAVDTKLGFLFTPVNNNPFYLMVEGKTLASIKPHLGFLYNSSNGNDESFKFYQKKCASCHGKNRNGIFDPLSKKNIEVISGYIPSLIGHSLFSKDHYEMIFDLKNFKEKHKNISMNENEVANLKTLFRDWDRSLLDKNLIQLRYHWAKFLDQENLPASNPPWGKITAMNIKTGKIIWETKTGKIEDSEDLNNMTGTISYGGLAASGGGVLFFTGTPDGYVYALNSMNGKVIWSYKMDAAGSCPPIIYEVDGEQYVSIVSTGGFFNEFVKKDSTIYTFALDKN